MPLIFNRKKKIIEKIIKTNKIRDPQNYIAFLSDYNYNALKMLYDYGKYDYFEQYLIYFSLICKKFKFNYNIDDISEIIWNFKKEGDFIKFNELVYMYGIDLIKDYFYHKRDIEFNKDIVNELEEFKIEKEDSDSFAIEKILSELPNEARPNTCYSKKDAINICKCYNFYKKYILNKPLNFILLKELSFIELFDKKNLELFSSFSEEELEKMDDKTRENLIMFLYIVTSAEINKINSIDEINDYVVRNYIELEQNNISYINYISRRVVRKDAEFFELRDNIGKILSYRSLNRVIKIVNASRDKFDFNDFELIFLGYIANIQKNKDNCDKLTLENLLKFYQTINEEKDEFVRKIIYKISTVYHMDMADSLTKFDKNNLEIVEDSENIYRYIGNEFRFLVHVTGGLNGGSLTSNPERWYERTSEYPICTSYISNDGPYMVHVGKNVVYGFNDISFDSIEEISNKNVEIEKSYCFADELPFYSETHNETRLRRAVNSDDSGVKVPDFILCFDVVRDIDKEHAEKHNIPIVIIDSKKFIIQSLHNLTELVNDDKFLDNLELYKFSLKSTLKWLNYFSVDAELQYTLEEEYKKVTLAIKNKENFIHSDNFCEVIGSYKSR